MSEQKEKRQYTREFKLETVKLYEASGKSMRAIEHELGITPYLLSKWVQQFREQEEDAFPGKGKVAQEKDAEVQRLRRERRSCARSVIS